MREYNPFDKMTFTSDRCFLCGIKLTDENRTKEHIYPKWLQHKFNLWNDSLVLLNHTDIKYKDLTIPCCRRCNGIMSAKIEKPIQTKVDAGYDEFIKCDRTTIFQWLNKIAYGILFKETSLKLDRSNPSIHTMSADGELMLTILASYAQEESLSVSENMKWRIRRNFEEGKPWSGLILGYRFQNGQFVVVPEEAEIVKRIFREYLDGLGATAIMKGLNEDGILTRLGKPWRTEGVLKILRNYNYTGNLILQKTYRENHLTKRKMKNNGEKPQYHAVGTHEAIIDLATFETVQEEIVRRAEHYSGKKTTVATYPFTGLIVCDGCGKHYRRKTTATGIVWICSTYNTHGKKACADSKAIPENVLYELTADTPLGDLTTIRAEKDNTLVFCFKNGEQTVKRWQDRSRRESWTEEMKEKARQQALAQHSKKLRRNLWQPRT